MQFFHEVSLGIWIGHLAPRKVPGSPLPNPCARPAAPHARAVDRENVQSIQKQRSNTKCGILLAGSTNSCTTFAPLWPHPILESNRWRFPMSFRWFGGHSKDGIESNCVGFHHAGSHSSSYANSSSAKDKSGL